MNYTIPIFMLNIDKFDAILHVTPEPQSINEVDKRLSGSGKRSNAAEYGAKYWLIDPSIWGSNTFGSTLQSALSSSLNGSNGYWVEVTDFKRYVVVNVGYHSKEYGRTTSKCFLIVFDDRGDGIVMSTMSKWRTISGYAQAVSYIVSSAQDLKSKCS